MVKLSCISLPQSLHVHRVRPPGSRKVAVQFVPSQNCALNVSNSCSVSIHSPTFLCYGLYGSLPVLGIPGNLVGLGVGVRAGDVPHEARLIVLSSSVTAPFLA